MDSVAQIVLDLETQDKNGTTQISEYVDMNMRDNINRTEAYLNSKHISGETDYLERPKPFFNICVGARNIWYRATDLDVKDFRVLPTNVKSTIKAFFATIYLQYWMRKINFGKFLNRWGLTLATHGSAICKFIEKSGELTASVMDWNNFLCDPIDFDNNVKVEKIYYTPAQLKKNKYFDKELVKQLIDNRTSRKTIDGDQKDNKDEYICVYEVHGELPLSYITDKESDEDTYVQQMHIITFQANKENPKDLDSYTLYSGREAKDPYIITHLIEKDGQTYTGGAVMNLFEAQWMVNDQQKMIRDHIELASKEIFQTMDDGFSGLNVLSNIENGQILKYKNQPITRLNNSPDIVAMQSYKADWQNISNQINGIAESMTNQAKSGTAWRQTQAELQEAHSLFELMTENKGLYAKDMLTKYIIPYIKKQMDNKDEIVALLQDYQITEFDQMYVPNETIRRVNEKKKKVILSGQIYDPMGEGADIAEAESGVRGELKGDKRIIKPSEISEKTWKEYFKDLEWDLEYDITGESKDVRGILDTLNTAFSVVASNPMILQDPNARMLFNKILTYSGGVSPLEIKAQPSPQITQPVQQPVAGVGGGMSMPTNQ